MKIARWYLALLPAMFLLPSTARADHKQALLSGKILTMSVPGKGIWPGRAMAIVDAKAKDVYKLLTGVASYKSFVPRIVDSKKVNNDVFWLKGKFPWPIKHATVKVKVKQGKKGGAYVMVWKMVSGTFKKYEGAAWIQPFGNRCILTYQMLMVPKIIAPEALMMKGLRNAVLEVVQAVRKRVKKKIASSTATAPAA
mgnify:CR=1 FL=1